MLERTYIEVLTLEIPCPRCGRAMKQVEDSFYFICTMDGTIFELTEADILGICGKMADNGESEVRRWHGESNG